MALVKCKECGNENAKSAKTCPKCGASLKMSLFKMVLIGSGSFVLLVVVLLIIGAVGAASEVAKGRKQAEQSLAAARAAVAQQPGTAPAPAAPEQPKAKAVAVGTLLSEYKSNEVRADGAFKDQWVTTTGKVGDVKKDILNKVYVTVGTGAAFEIPMVQCFVADDQIQKASTFSEGDQVTVTGQVDGLMMNVIVRECRFD